MKCASIGRDQASYCGFNRHHCPIEAKGKAKRLRDGHDVLIISSGLMAVLAIETVRLLKTDRIGFAVVHRPTIKPLETTTLLREAGVPGRLVVAENHSRIGGLDEAVAALLLDNDVAPSRFRQIALPDAYLDAGALPTLHTRYRISAAAMAEDIRSWL